MLYSVFNKLAGNRPALPWLVKISRVGEAKNIAQNNNIPWTYSSMPANGNDSHNNKRFKLVAARHLIRIGVMGHVGRFDSVDGVLYTRHARVICRTSRGLEVGEVLSSSEVNGNEADGTLVRRLTVEDDLLLTRIERNRDEAFRACNELLAERRLPAVLMDVEHLFDGQSLYFYFLGDVGPELEAITSELASVYETEVQFQKFSETLTAGCGPGCGTEAATGQGCSNGSCASCAVASACGSRGAAG